MPVWVNELGGVTFRIDGGTEYVKVAPPRWAGHLVAEAERLRWAVTYLAVPQVLGAGAGWLHTAGLPGPDFPFGSPEWVTDSLPMDRLVVCHGDACAPNTLIDDAGRCCGHADLGDLGVADRWADLAVAEWSLRYNYRGDWRAEFFEAYGVAPDQDRMDHYLRLWEDGE